MVISTIILVVGISIKNFKLITFEL